MPSSTPPYPGQPVALAIVEVKHPSADSLGPASVAALKSDLRALFPIHRTEQMTEFVFTAGPSGAGQVQQGQQMPRFVTRDRQSSITYRRDAVVIETTRYPGWTQFKDWVKACLAAREDVAPVDGVERIGIRFIDEIRIPGDGEPEWRDWVPSLTGPAVDVADLGILMRQQQSVVQYITGNAGETLTLRYGAVVGPPSVQSTPNLVRVDVPKPGPFFLLDTDAAWTVTDGMQVPAFESDAILTIADQLHTPMKELFERLISDRLREEILNGQ